jgi:hypothetical protein
MIIIIHSLRGENRSVERRSSLKESLRGEKVFVEKASPKREERRGESSSRELSSRRADLQGGFWHTQ